MRKSNKTVNKASFERNSRPTFGKNQVKIVGIAAREPTERQTDIDEQEDELHEPQEPAPALDAYDREILVEKWAPTTNPRFGTPMTQKAANNEWSEKAGA